MEEAIDMEKETKERLFKEIPKAGKWRPEGLEYCIQGKTFDAMMAISEIASIGFESGIDATVKAIKKSGVRFDTGRRVGPDGRLVNPLFITVVNGVAIQVLTPFTGTVVFIPDDSEVKNEPQSH